MRAFAREIDVFDGAGFDAPPSAADSKQADGDDLAGFENRRRRAEGSDGNGFTKWDRRRATMT